MKQKPKKQKTPHEIQMEELERKRQPPEQHPYQKDYERVHGKQIWITTLEEERKSYLTLGI